MATYDLAIWGQEYGSLIYWVEEIPPKVEPTIEKRIGEASVFLDGSFVPKHRPLFPLGLGQLAKLGL
ncbi:hypothetical protein Gogos_003167, partial [Gossypium gossypioides]|nr:hypothetical protein [Gossypium gossypioides]